MTSDQPDSPFPDSPLPDSPLADSPLPDSPLADSPFPDVAFQDALAPDALPPDALPPDALPPDALPPDALPPDALPPAAPSGLPACPSGLPLRIRRSGRKLAFRVLPGAAESVPAARCLARDLLGDRHPAIDTALLLLSELVTNSVRHSQSSLPGGTVTVVICSGSDGVLIQVRDDGGPAEPRLLNRGAASAVAAEHGYGLLLVSALAHTWGTMTTRAGRVTWCRVTGEMPAESRIP